MKTQYFYLEDGNNKVDLMDLSRLSSLAVTLKPLEETTEVLGHAAALYNYMDKNRDNFLFNSYSLLISEPRSNELLCTNIHLCLLEKSFREKGASPETINAYVNVVNNYHKLLDYNKLMFEENSSKAK